MIGIALVDYDNVRQEQNERTTLDVQTNATVLGDQLGAAGARLGLEEFRLRLYGGWVTQNNGLSQRANWMLTALGNMRGLRSGVRVIPEMVFAPALLGGERLIGTLRTDRNPIEQKMVDTLIAVDVISHPECDVLAVVSDDDDMVPGLVTAARSRSRPPLVVRVRPQGAALNDGLLQRLSVSVHSL